jgi:phospholipid/cholesterol/gamma-HCH transport system substrate-binding protein
MMKIELTKEVKIGLFVVGTAALLFWGINFLKGKNLLTRSHTYYTTFREVDGLNVSTEVLFRGMKVGSVTDVIFDPSAPERIVVEFTVPSKYPVPVDSRIDTHNTYVIGGKVLVIEYGRSPESFRNRDTIPSIDRANPIDNIMGQFGEVKQTATDLADNVNRTLDALNALLSEENIRNLSGAMAGLNRVISTDLHGTLSNLNALTASLNAGSHQIDRILANAGNFSDSLATIDLPELVGNINATVLTLNEVVTKINEGEGSLSQLVNDRELYEGLKSSSESLDLLLKDLKENPKRYVHFSVFGRKE